MSRKSVLAAAVILLVMSAGCIGGTDTAQQQENDQVSGDAEGPPSEQPTILAPTSKDEISYIDVNITADTVRPTLATGEPREFIRWRNLNDFPVYLYFAWMQDNLTVEPGESRVMLIDGQTSYKVYRNNTRELVGEGIVRIE